MVALNDGHDVRTFMDWVDNSLQYQDGAVVVRGRLGGGAVVTPRRCMAARWMR